AAACCRRVWFLLSETTRRAIEVAERYADGAASAPERDAASTASEEGMRQQRLSPPFSYAGWAVSGLTLASASDGAKAVIHFCPLAVSRSVCHDSELAGQAGFTELHEQAFLLRDIFGTSPSCPPPALDPDLLSWNGGTLRMLARAAYDDRILPVG